MIGYLLAGAGWAMIAYSGICWITGRMHERDGHDPMALRDRSQWTAMIAVVILCIAILYWEWAE